MQRPRPETSCRTECAIYYWSLLQGLQQLLVCEQHLGGQPPRVEAGLRVGLLGVEVLQRPQEVFVDGEPHGLHNKLCRRFDQSGQERRQFIDVTFYFQQHVIVCIVKAEDQTRNVGCV